jgi:hypothetical protein
MSFPRKRESRCLDSCFRRSDISRVWGVQRGEAPLPGVGGVPQIP